MLATDIDQEEAKWINSYADEVSRVFGDEFDTAGARLKDSKKLLLRFTNAINSMLSKGRSFISAVDESHNELCVASQLLANSNPRFTLIEYEPVLTGCGKSIDFRGSTDHGMTWFIDVKTIKPKPKDRWDQFEKAIEQGWFPENVRVILSEDWLGGEIWHNMFAARARMLEYALSLEEKIRGCQLGGNNTFFILVLCGEGFHWHQDGLEDFVSFYRSGIHRADDPFSKGEAKYIADSKITLDRTISHFGCVNRPQFAIRHRRLSWNVQPPRAAAF